uniref:Uncharacterized protein n=1 Tax=uncultured delta proteobacterium HF4000_08N17 TaxID=710836 RepID=E0XVG1_9DELT|nr:hypothetical protein [uncultured delta proteobacterium HF4000_08N17]
MRETVIDLGSTSLFTVRQSSTTYPSSCIIYQILVHHRFNETNLRLGMKLLISNTLYIQQLC